jgi:hypothetical protein
MEDFDRYGDYNEVDESPTKNPVLTFIKAFCVIFVFLVIAFVAFRVFTFNYYPKSMTTLHFNEALTEHYNEKGGEISALTQKLRAPYDDEDKGNFFCDNLIIIPEANQLQLSVRYNTSLIESLKAELKLDTLSPDDKDNFSFRLYKNGDSEDEAAHLIGTLDYAEFESFLMYRYYKLVFNEVDFEMDSDTPVNWIRLEIFVNGQSGDKPYAMIAVYENHENYSTLKEYKTSGGERP